MSFESPEGSQENSEKFERSFAWKSEFETLDKAQEITEQELTKLGWSQESAEDFSLAVREVVANAVIHGNLNVNKGEDPDTFFERIKAAEKKDGNKLVEVFFRFTNDEALAEVKDEGDFVASPPKEIDPNKPSLEGSGRGLNLIWDKVSDVIVSPGKMIIRTRRKDKEDKI
jgi:anti-sigma regulatory factor (Ser/Thr protein kinase)